MKREKSIYRTRRGNELAVAWSIFIRENRDGQIIKVPYNLEGKDLKLSYSTLQGSAEVTEFLVKKNIINWIFKGYEQIYLGRYTLTLFVNNGKRGMVALDRCEAFELTERTCDLCPSSSDVVEVAALNLTSDLDTTLIQPVIPVVGDNGNWWVEGEDTGLPSRGEKGDPGKDLKFEDLTPDQKNELKGEPGRDGYIIYPTFSLKETHLMMDTHGASNQVALDNGHLTINT